MNFFYWLKGLLSRSAPGMGSTGHQPTARPSKKYSRPNPMTRPMAPRIDRYGSKRGLRGLAVPR